MPAEIANPIVAETEVVRHHSRAVLTLAEKYKFTATCAGVHLVRTVEAYLQTESPSHIVHAQLSPSVLRAS